MVRLLLVGDIALCGDYVSRYGGERPRWGEPFRSVRPIFKQADLKVGNLESPLFHSIAPRPKKNLLAAPPESVAALAYLDFTALGLGNNHITDQGAEGVTRTREALEATGIAPYGAGEDLATARKPAVLRAKDLSFAFLAYAVHDADVMADAASESTEGSVPLSLGQVERDIADVGSKADHVVVSLHWGYQGDRYPSPEQIDAARKIIDMGALIVHGHHPHVLQGIERHKQGLIVYSLGNFFFPSFVRTDGQRIRFGKDSRRTAVVLCDVDRSGIWSVEAVPLEMDLSARLRVLDGAERARAEESLALLSATLDAPDYARVWREHHERSVRRRALDEARLRLGGYTLSAWKRARTLGVRGAVTRLRPRHAVALLRLLWQRIRPPVQQTAVRGRTAQSGPHDTTTGS